MKLRQKLAAVLATAMVVTAVPVVTMADSENKIVKSTQVIEEDAISTDAALKIKFEDATGTPEEFYFTLTNAEWLDADDAEQNGCLVAAGFTPSTTNADEWTTSLGGVSVTYTRQNDTTLKVVAAVPAATSTATPEVKFPLPIKATGGAVSVKVTGEGSETTVTEGSYTFVSTGEDAASVFVDTTDLNSFYDNGELSKITLKETFVGSLAVKPLVLKVELNDTDFEFLSSSAVTVKGTYGYNFTSTTTSTTGPKVEFTVDPDDKSTGYIRISGLTKGTSLGRLEITGLKVDNDENDIQTGDLLADIEAVDSYDTFVGGAELDKDYTYAVAKIANYGAYIEMKDEKAVNIVAGREEEVTFEVIENVDDVFVGSRTITLGLKDDQGKTDKSFFMISDAVKADPESILDNSDSKAVVKNIEFEWADEDDFDAKTPTYWDKQGVHRATAIKVTLENTVDSKDINANEEIDKFKVKTKVYVPVDQQDKKSIEITGEVRGVDEFKSATAVSVVDPFDVTFDKTTFKVGLQNQVAGKITITEKDKEMLQKGDLVLDIAEGSNDQKGITIEEEGTLTVTGDLKQADLDDTGSQQDTITLKRQSKAASALTVEKMEVTVDRTVPEGNYDLKLSGSAIDKYDGDYTVEDYVVIGTPNTQDMAATNGLAKGTATFSIGDSKYVLNGVEKAMDAASYVQDPGYTMVPVRFVAQAFGVAEKDIMFGNGTVTLFAGNRTVQLTNGSNVAVVNGARVSMATKVVIKNGRSYAPIGEIARILGVNSAWDNTTKTATFTNN